MIAVVIGSTGLVGTLVIKKLLAEQKVTKVVSISRSSLSIKNPKLQEVLVPDLNELSSQANKLKGDIYFCCLGTTIKTAGSRENFRKVDLDAVVTYAQIAKSHQAQALLLVSAMGANAKSSIFYNQVKGQAEEALKDLNIRSLIIYRPSLLMGERKEFRIGEKIAAKIAGPLSIIMPIKMRKMMMTEAEDLAEAMVKQAPNAPTGTLVVTASEI